MDAVQLRAFYDRDAAQVAADPAFPDAHASLLALLESGGLRAASPDGQGGWTVNAWVKQAILAGFRAFSLEQQEGPGWPFFDKGAYPARAFALADAVSRCRGFIALLVGVGRRQYATLRILPDVQGIITRIDGNVRTCCSPPPVRLLFPGIGQKLKVHVSGGFLITGTSHGAQGERALLLTVRFDHFGLITLGTITIDDGHRALPGFNFERNLRGLRLRMKGRCRKDHPEEIHGRHGRPSQCHFLSFSVAVHHGTFPGEYRDSSVGR